MYFSEKKCRLEAQLFRKTFQKQVSKRHSTKAPDSGRANTQVILPLELLLKQSK